MYFSVAMATVNPKKYKLLPEIKYSDEMLCSLIENTSIIKG